MPTLAVDNFNIVCATLGGFITLFGLVSYLFKEKFYLSETLLSTIFGIIFSPHGANLIRPLDYALGSEENLETITLYFTRLVLGVQLVLAGVQLPSKYLWKERKSLSILLGPGMCIMWISTSLLVWGLAPNTNIVAALAVGACVTPTDPVLSNNIVKGKFADKNIPPPLQKIIIAESGANDGLGYPFLFIALYLLKYVGSDGAGYEGAGGEAMRLWFAETWAYTILLSVVYGAVVGWLAKELLHWAEERHYVDRESFLVFAITLALFIVGTCGMIGSDDVLACFIAGNAFTWDDWFRLETMDDSLQPTIDMLLNVAIFMWFGAICPWHRFVDNDVIPIYRLIPLGILVLLLRRLPMVLGFHKFIHQVEHVQHALFVGFFGPIGVSAIFYLYVSREFLAKIKVDGHQRADAAKLAELMNVVIWFLAVCSIFAHGLSIPLGKLGIYLPRTISTALSNEGFSISTSEREDEPADPSQLRQNQGSTLEERTLTRLFRHRRPTTSERGAFHPATDNSTSYFPESLINVGRSIMSSIRRPRDSAVPGNAKGARDSTPTTDASKADTDAGAGADDDSHSTSSLERRDTASSHPEISNPINPRRIGRTIDSRPDGKDNDKTMLDGRSNPQTPTRSRVVSPARDGASTPRGGGGGGGGGAGSQRTSGNWQRSIRFPDEGPSNSEQSEAKMEVPNSSSSDLVNRK